MTVKFGHSQPLTRLEDARLIRGQGTYTDDIDLDGQVWMWVLRAPVAHAEISRLDLSAARKAPGVVAVLSGEDLAADGIAPLPCVAPAANTDGSLCAQPPHPALAQGRVRHVGDGVAVVVAETLAQAREAAELIEVDYAALPAVVRTEKALDPASPQVWPEVDANRCFEWELGDKAKADALFAEAAHVVGIDIVNNRVVANSMETRAAIGLHDPDAESYTLYATTQGVHMVQGMLAQGVLGIPPEKLRVITRDVGGGFGMKLFLYPEYVLVLYAARKTGRPVKWTGDRSEAFLSDAQGRDHVTHAELAIDADGRARAMRVETVANMGAYLSSFGPFIPSLAARVMGSVYTFESIHVKTTGVFTNTVPVDAYRGAGRPEANYMVERLMDKAAFELGLAPDEFRRRNFIPKDAFPYTSAMGEPYDGGDFAANMERAMADARWPEFAERRKAAKERGKLAGIGMACYIEATGAAPTEIAEIRFTPDDKVEVVVGTQSTGQGHETAFAQLLRDKLGIDPEAISFLQGDTATVPSGGGTGGSRSLYMEGGALMATADKVIDKGRMIAAQILETSNVDIEFGEGSFRVAGTDRSIGIMELARQARALPDLPEALADGLDSAGEIEIAASTYPNGCHICEVEIDPDTGTVEITGYSVVDDFGVIVNPMLVAGQVHGGIAQGIGQAMTEHVVWDDEGQLLSGSFMDYAMPRADDLPAISIAFNEEIPCRTNPLGSKGCGEAGTVGAAPAFMNALMDALRPLGVTRLDMPATPSAIWQALQAAEYGQAAE